jgi:hypothetical protein
MLGISTRMDTTTLWPFFFEVNLSQRTMFVTVDESGMMRWVDHAGRFGHVGGFGGFTSTGDGEVQHFRGGHTISPSEAEREMHEFTVDVQLEPAEFEPIQSLIARIGKPWFAGWDAPHSEQLHALLAAIYWRHVNQYVHHPFDERDA